MKFIILFFALSFKVGFLNVDEHIKCIDFSNNLNIEDKDSLLNSVKSAKKGFMGRIALAVFSFEKNSLKAHKDFDGKKLKKIEDFVNDSFSDVSEILFHNNSINAHIKIVPELNVSSNCSNQLVKVSPNFLQTIFLKSLNSSINVNSHILDNRVYFKNQNDFFRIFFAKSSPLKKLDNSSIGTRVSYEFKRIKNYINYEMTKALAFVLGHENYHFLSNCKMGLTQEFNADALGVLVYQFLNYSISYDVEKLTNNLFVKEEIKLVSKISKDSMIKVFTGRSINYILQNIYVDTQFEKPSITHPSLENRLVKVDSLLLNTHPDQLYNHFIKTNILKKQDYED